MAVQLQAQEKNNGLGSNMGNLFMTSDAKTRSISPENFNGEKGKGGMATEGTGKDAAHDLGQTWKVSPSVVIKKHTTFTIAEITGPGVTPSFDFTGTTKLHHRWKYLSVIFSVWAGVSLHRLPRLLSW